MKPRRNPKFTSDSLTSGYCFTIATKGELDSITKGELDKDTLKISTKGEFFYIRTVTNYKAGTTGGIARKHMTIQFWILGNTK
jgi:hypothetical protein